MKSYAKLAGATSIVIALIYLIAFIYFGAIWSFPYDGNPGEQMTYLAENQLPFSAINFLMYVIFGCFLSFLVVTLYEELKHTDNVIVSIGAVFGVIWVGLVIASGMLSTIGLNQSLKMMSDGTSVAFNTWNIVSLIVESIGGGNELVGGAWVLLLSIAALKGQMYSRYLNYFGLFVGVAGLSTVYPNEIFTEIFGIFQMVWFVWLGLNLLNTDGARWERTSI